MRISPLRDLMRASAALALGLAVAACGASTSEDGAASTPATLHRGNTAEPLSLDPHKVSGTWENNIVGDMFLGLVTENAEAEPAPGVAGSWSVSEDGLTWTFELRENQVWSDGVPVTADDFVFALRRLLDPATIAQYASLQYPIKNAQAVNLGQAEPETLGVRAVDADTLEIELEYPAPFLPSLLTHYTAYPVPAHVVREHGDQWVRPENIVTNGPYTLGEWRTNDFVRLVKSETFYDAANVCFEEIFYYPTNDQNTGARLVRSGELDINNDFPGNNIDFYREQLPGYVHVAPYLTTDYLAFNVERPPFDDVRVRQALALAVDRDFIVREVLGAGQIPATALVPPGIANYAGEAQVDWMAEDLEARRARARLLLSEAGYGPDNPLRFEYFHRNTRDNPRIAPVLQSDWRAIADWVDADIAGIETQIHYDNLRTRNFQVADAGWVADYNDPANFLYLLETKSGPMNYPGWSSAAFDGLMEEANRTLDMDARAALMAQAEQIMLDDIPVSPLWHNVSKNLVSPTVTGWVDNATDIHRSRYLCRATPPA